MLIILFLDQNKELKNKSIYILFFQLVVFSDNAMVWLWNISHRVMFGMLVHWNLEWFWDAREPLGGGV